MNNKLLESKLCATREALHTVNYQIRELKSFYSREQVRCWFVHRRKLKETIRMLEAEKKTQEVKEAALQADHARRRVGVPATSTHKNQTRQ